MSDRKRGRASSGYPGTHYVQVREVRERDRECEFDDVAVQRVTHRHLGGQALLFHIDPASTRRQLVNYIDQCQFGLVFLGDGDRTSDQLLAIITGSGVRENPVKKRFMGALRRGDLTRAACGRRTVGVVASYRLRPHRDDHVDHGQAVHGSSALPCIARRPLMNILLDALMTIRGRSVAALLLLSVAACNGSDDDGAPPDDDPDTGGPMITRDSYDEPVAHAFDIYVGDLYNEPLIALLDQDVLARQADIEEFREGVVYSHYACDVGSADRELTPTGTNAGEFFEFRFDGCCVDGVLRDGTVNANRGGYAS